MGLPCHAAVCVWSCNKIKYLLHVTDEILSLRQENYKNYTHMVYNVNGISVEHFSFILGYLIRSLFVGMMPDSLIIWAGPTNTLF